MSQESKVVTNFGLRHMNQQGGVVVFILIGFLIVSILPPLLFAIWWPAKIIFQIISVFLIYSLVKGYLGPSPLTLIISAVLIYFFVFKWFYVYSALYTFQFLLGLQILSVITWTIGTTMRPKPQG